MSVYLKSRVDNSTPIGVVVICDIHLTSTPPSSRQDDYTSVVLNKLSRVVKMSNELNLVVLICGDVFHRPLEISEKVKIELMEILYNAKFPPLVIPGNHDMSGSRLSEKDSLNTLKTSRSCIVSTESGEMAYFKITLDDGDITVGVGGTPYGQLIPSNASWSRECDIGLWMTHHNLAFSTAYKEQALTNFKEVVGVNHIFNGHLHHESTSVKSGETTYYNPGSMSRTKRDESERTPCVSIWTPEDGLERVDLKSSTTEYAFKIGGRNQPTEKTIKEAGIAGKRFVDFLKKNSRDDIDIDREFENLFKSGNIDHKIHNLLLDLSSLAKKEVLK